jgi:murein DD-endopeptidase MepM/ murein hydrolase activator NlpD
MRKRTLYAVIVLISVFLVLSAYYFFSLKKKLQKELVISATYDSIAVPKPVRTSYGIPVDSFYVEYGIIKKDQNLSHIFAEYNLPEGSFNQILVKSKDVFDLRKIRYGNRYTVFLSVDTLYEVRYFVYEHTPVEYVFFDLRDSIMVKLCRKEVRVMDKFCTGTITSSLWNAIKDKNLNPELTFELSEIFAWTIDFFGLAVGDSFSVIYEEHYADTVCVGLGSIYSAYFRHAGRDFYAIPFVQDSTLSFYDLDGNSLRKAFLKAPLRFSRVSSRYSHSRLHPILKIRRPHYGVDYVAPIGTPVHAIGDGKVIKTAYNSNAGRMVKIRHNSVYSTSYLHLSRFKKGIKTGAYVQQGDVIGYVGSSGLSTGPHLDFRFYKNGHPVDPLKVDAPSVEPIREENRASFDSVKVVAVQKLKSISGI